MPLKGNQPNKFKQVAKQKLSQLANLTASPPLEVVRSGTGHHLRLAGQGLWAKITEQDSEAVPYSYGWVEQQTDGAGNFTDKPGGQSGSAGSVTEGTLPQAPAYEVNDIDVEIDNIVWLMPGENQSWLFVGNGMSTTLTVVTDLICGDAGWSVQKMCLTYIAGQLVSTEPGPCPEEEE